MAPLVGESYGDWLDRHEEAVSRLYESRERPGGDVVDILDKATGEVAWSLEVVGDQVRKLGDPLAEPYLNWWMFVLDQRVDIRDS